MRRRVRQELGVEVDDLRLLLPAFRYRAELGGVVENEMCPVFAGRVRGRVDPDPDEVGDTAWEPWQPFREAVLDGSREVSVWCREQVQQLPADPDAAPAAPPGTLPPAAR